MGLVEYFVDLGISETVRSCARRDHEIGQQLHFGQELRVDEWDVEIRHLQCAVPDSVLCGLWPGSEGGASRSLVREHRNTSRLLYWPCVIIARPGDRHVEQVPVASGAATQKP